MLVEVTADDIKNGRRGSPGCCPVALAMSRAFGADYRCGSTIYRKATEGGFQPMPHVVTQRIVRFDIGEQMEPFSFHVPDRN